MMEVTGKVDLGGIIHPEDAQRIHEWRRNIMETSQTEVKLRSSSGEYRWFHIRSHPLSTSNNPDQIIWISTMTDVHDHYVLIEQQKQQAQLQASEHWHGRYNPGYRLDCHADSGHWRRAF
eukprot:TRINITY_DN15536_c0_g1_i1.p1 TRINITY_DN15536_c0_g1~~TRINITY_DN15536_c0_g1_i1.p1  ORF type:complete len:120 (-),score=1.59 TRINITY_DN15536_c0_g1_i1:75-434(-)